MKVLHLYKTYLPETFGGVETFIDQLVRNLMPMGVQSEILALTSDKTESTIRSHGYTVHKVPKLWEFASTPFSLRAIQKFYHIAQTVDVIHYHFPWPWSDIMHFMARINKPSLVTYHSDIVKQKHLLKIYKPLMHCFLSSVDRLVVTSPNYLSTSSTLKKFSNKSEVIPIGLNKAHYSLPEKSKLSFWKEKYNSKFFLYIGAIRYYKGLQFLVEGARYVNAPILIIGGGNKGIRSQLELQKNQLGLDNVHFLGELEEEDKIALLTLCYGVICPSHLRSEAFGISLLEGAMFGKPLISCEIGTGTTYINHANETGLVVPPADSNALGQAMTQLLSNPTEAAKMGKAAEERYYELFTADKMALSYYKLYEDLLKERKH